MRLRNILLLFILLGALPGVSTASTSQSSGKADQATHWQTEILVSGKRDRYRVHDSRSSTRTDTPITNTAQSVYVVPRAAIDDQAMTGLADLVRFVPGMTMGQGEGHRDAPVFRGNLTTADFFVDGVRDDLQYLRDLYNVDRVDVVKGAAALSFGRGTGAGAMNRVSKTAQQYPIGSAEFLISTHGAARLAADWNYSISNEIAARINLVADENRGFRDSVTASRRGFAPTVSMQIDPETRLDFFGEYFDDHRTVDRGVPSIDGRPWRDSIHAFFGNADQSKSGINVRTIRSVLQKKPDDRINVRSTLSFANYSKHYENVFPGGPIDASLKSVKIDAYNSSVERQNIFWQTDLEISGTINDVDHLALIGIEVGQQKSENLRLNAVASSFSIFDRGARFQPDFLNVPATDNRNELRVASLILQNQMSLTGALKVTIGIRSDDLNLTFDDRRKDQPDFSRHDRLVSPKLGVVWNATRSLSLYGGWTLAFLPQSGEQFNNLSASRAALSPEKFNSREIGLRWQPSRELLVNVAAYQLDRTNTIAPGPTQGANVLTGSQRAQGLEIGVQGSVSKKWNVIGAMALQNSEITSTTTAAPAGRASPLVPKFSASLWNRYATTLQFDLGVGAIYQGPQFASISNAVVLPPYARFDAAIFYNGLKNTTVQLNFENVANKRYWPTAHNDNNISPGPPLTAKIKVSRTF